MRIYRHIGDVRRVEACTAAVSGLDGLHLGHQRLLNELVESSPERGAVVFDDGAESGPRLAGRRRCFEELDALGVAVVVVARGVERVARAVSALRPVAIMVGACEAGRWGELAGARVIAAATSEDGTSITSDALRDAVRRGDVRAASAMLGRPYAVDGRVVHGFHRGATIGVPTANLRVRDLQLPPDGVYAVTARTAAHRGVGVANLGTNPTFGNDVRSLETNLFDFEGDLYGERLEVGFVERLRGEKKFDGVDALVAQIHRDIEAARGIHQRR